MTATAANPLQALLEEKTLVLVKPDAVKRGLVGTIITRFEQVGLKLVGLKMVQADRKRLEGHFPKDDAWIRGMGQKTLDNYVEYGVDPKVTIFGTDDAYEIGLRIKEWNFRYLSSGPVVAIVLQGVHAVDVVRKMIGHTLPLKAQPGTIRGDYSINAPDLANLVGSACKNMVHASGNVEEAQSETGCWFLPDELISWERVDEFLMFLEGEAFSATKNGKVYDMQDKSLEEMLQDLEPSEPRKAAEVAYVIGRIHLGEGRTDEAHRYGEKAIELLDQCPTETAEDCAARFVTLKGVALPSYFHQDVVRDRLKMLPKAA
jgi:nucleoside-diphosphate kinase